MEIAAPFFSMENLRERARDFLLTYHPASGIPVPIEHIVEFQFEIDIVPMPGLHRGFEIDAYITSDLQEIRVDQAVFESRLNRYRFSLAHELAHRVLHADVFQQLAFSSIGEWKSARSLIPEREYRFLEWHANAFAGLILVPPEQLYDQFERAKKQLEKIGMSIDDATPAAWDYLEGWLAEQFMVSKAVIAKRGPADDLWDV